MGKRKSSSIEDNHNHDICDMLLEIAEYEKNVSRNIHKYNAYRKAVSVLETHPVRIKSGQEARQLKGIGDKIAKKINEYLKTGQMEKLEKIRKDDTNTAINLLTTVTGIGPAKAKDLVQHGITTIKDLQNHKDKLTHHQLIGLKYYEDFEKKIPRSEIEQIEDIIRTAINELDKEHIITICGSYRRGAQASGDIDTLVTHPSYTSKDSKKSPNLLKKVVKALEDVNLVTDTLSLGDVKFMGVCNLGAARNLQPTISRCLDIRLFPHDQYYCGVLYFTGSNLFNQTMRAHALEKGFTLNEYTLRPVGSTGVPGEAVPIGSEKDIFEYIDFPYKEPVDRSM